MIYQVTRLQNTQRKSLSPHAPSYTSSYNDLLQNLHDLAVFPRTIFGSKSRYLNISMRTSFGTSSAYDDQVLKGRNFSTDDTRLWNFDKRLAEKIRLKIPILDQSEIVPEMILSFKYRPINISHS